MLGNDLGGVVYVGEGDVAGRRANLSPSMEKEIGDTIRVRVRVRVKIMVRDQT